MRFCVKNTGNIYLSSFGIIHHLSFIPDKVICEKDDFLCFDGGNSHLATGGAVGFTCNGNIVFTPKLRAWDQER